MKKSNCYWILVLSLCSFTSCEGFFGKKINKDFLDVPIYNDKTVAYVPIQPALKGFEIPTDIIIGWDNLIYVADSGKQQIISFDEAGNKLGRFTVPGLSAIAQDRQLDILATGTKDTTVGGVTLRLPAIYRIHQMNNQGGVGLENAQITHVNIHPFCFNSAATPTITDAQVHFTSIAILADNKYYVSKTGTGSGTQGDAVVLFNAQDKFITPISVNTTVGIFANYFKKPHSIVGYAQPPQTPAVDKKADFLFTSYDEAQVLKVQGITYKESEFGASYEVIGFPQVKDTSKADNILYAPNRFSKPSDATIAGDGTGYIWVVDAAKDSLYQFNGKGYEGVNPPPGSTTTRAIAVSFGGTGEGLLQFRRPMAVAYFNKIVYVADAGNKRVLRFKLTTDFR
jgi:hypothetical protein